MRKGHRKPKTWVQSWLCHWGKPATHFSLKTSLSFGSAGVMIKGGNNFLTFTAGPKQIQMPAGAGQVARWELVGKKQKGGWVQPMRTKCPTCLVQGYCGMAGGGRRTEPGCPALGPPAPTKARLAPPGPLSHTPAPHPPEARSSLPHPAEPPPLTSPRPRVFRGPQAGGSGTATAEQQLRVGTPRGAVCADLSPERRSRQRQTPNSLCRSGAG